MKILQIVMVSILTRPGGRALLAARIDPAVDLLVVSILTDPEAGRYGGLGIFVLVGQVSILAQPGGRALQAASNLRVM